MRETRLSGSEGGVPERASLPLCAPVSAHVQSGASPLRAYALRPETERNCIGGDAGWGATGGERPVRRKDNDEHRTARNAASLRRTDEAQTPETGKPAELRGSVRKRQPGAKGEW